MRGLRRVVSVYDVNKATRLAIEAGLAKVCFGEQLMSLAGVPSVCVCACDGLPEVLPVSFPSYFLSLSTIFSIFSIIFIFFPSFPIFKCYYVKKKNWKSLYCY